MSRPTSFGIGRFQDRRKGELCRLLEVANMRLAEARPLIEAIFDVKSGADLSNRVYRLQEQIRELKQLVKQ